MKILCVDDEVWVLKSIQRLFKKTNYALEFVTSGHEALEILAQKSVDLIISDFRMPQMSGLELLQQARILQPFTKNILLSSWTDGKQIRQAVESGTIDKIISKPWNNDELLAEIHLCFGHQYQA